jgi:chorismate mutase
LISALDIIITTSNNRRPFAVLKLAKKQDEIISARPSVSRFLIKLQEENMPLRGIRGATIVNEDEPDQILEATRELLEMIVQENPGLDSSDICSVIFTMTDDMKSVYPAKAARGLGWVQVPLLCMQEIPVQGSLKRCIRVLLHWNTKVSQAAVRHVYLKEAQILRPDLINK